MRLAAPLVLLDIFCFVGVSGSFLLFAWPWPPGEEKGASRGPPGEEKGGSGLFGGLSQLSADWSDTEPPWERGSCGEDLEDEVKEGEGDFCAAEGDTECGDSVLELTVSEVTALQPLCSENLLAEKKLGFEFLKQGELGGTGGRGSLAGL